MNDFPQFRLRSDNGQVNSQGNYVLYWMTAFRRVDYNFSLQRAVDWARELDKPLLVFEALRCGYHWASDRLHRFVIEGMQDNQARLQDTRANYFPYLEPEPGAGSGLLAALAEEACVVVGDDFPSFFLPRMVRAARKQIPVRFELVDSNGLFPLRATDRVFARAYDFRRFLQKNLPDHLAEFPRPHPLQGAPLPEPCRLPKRITDRWPSADISTLLAGDALQQFPIDHEVGPACMRGGAESARETLDAFLDRKLAVYSDDRNQPEEDASSGLSPFLHFGHISAHDVFDRVMRREAWSPAQLSDQANGSSTGWWGCSEAAESFLDELITWREIGYNMCALRDDYDQYESLPAWAQQTLADHAGDPREHLYQLEQFEHADTHDELWNAAQNQLRREGRMHNYLRMLWGKKILEWSDAPQSALATMIELNNKYAVDGRNPNSYSGIFWVLGRYDRAWGPERRIFGKIRYMSSDNTARKLRVKNYVRKYTSEPPQREFDF